MSDYNDQSTSKALAPLTRGEVSPEVFSLLAPDIEKAQALIAGAISQSTQRVRARNWERFSRWCEERGAEPFPASPDVVVIYVSSMANAGYSLATIAQHLGSISAMHKEQGHTSPTASPRVKTVIQGLRRERGSQQDQKQALLKNSLVECLRSIPDGLKGDRDRALLAIGFYTACRRSELVAFRVEDMTREAEGILLHIRKSKTDQEGRGRVVVVPRIEGGEFCPVTLLDRYLTENEIDTGFIFRSVRRHELPLSPRDVARIVKSAVERVGLDPSEFAGHSLRSGFVTSARKAGATDFEIMKQTGHKTRVMIDRYTRDTDAFDQNGVFRVAK